MSTTADLPTEKLTKTSAARPVTPALQPRPKPIALGESFSGLLKTRPVAKTRRFRLHVLKSDACVEAMGFTPGDLQRCDLQQRYGILVPKRLVRRAVDRNALKRLCRQMCRQFFAEKAMHLLKSPEANMQAYAVLVCVTQTTHAIPPSDHSLWLAELHQLFACLQ